MLINSFCQKLENLTTSAKSLIRFKRNFSGDLGRCNKMIFEFELKDDIKPVFKKKEMCPSPLYHKWMKNSTDLKEPGSCRKLSTVNGIDRRDLMLHSKTISFMKPGRNFCNTKWRKFFLKLTSVTRIFKYQLKKNVWSCSVSTHIVSCTGLGIFQFGSRLCRQSSNK